MGYDWKKIKKSLKTTTTEKKEPNTGYDWNKIKSKTRLKTTINFDTIDSDLKSLGTTVESIYNGWQTQETMNNTKASILTMQERLNAYQEYAKLFGGTDVTDIANSYQAILEDWDNRATTYGKFKTAEDYTKAAEREKSLPTADLNAVQREVADLDKQLAEIRAQKKKLDSDYKKSGGYIPVATNYNFPVGDEIKPYQEWQAKSSELENKIKTLEDSGYLGELKTKKNVYELEHKVDLFKPEYEGKADFEEKSKYVTTYNENKKTNIFTGPLKYEDLTYEYINNVDGARDEIQAWDEALNKDGNGYESEWQKKGYDLLREDEIKIYNYKRREEGEDSANQFLEEMAPVLNKRRTDKLSEGWEQNAEKLPILSNAATVLLKPAGAIVGAIDDAVTAVQGKDYNPYSYAHTISNFVSDTRKYTGEDIEEKTKGVELFGQNIPSFLYNTGMSVADSVYGVASVGKFNSVLMGTSAFQDKAKEMVESGAEQDVVWKSAITSGVAETLFEHIGIDNLFKIKNVDSLSSLIKNALKQAGAEGFEEIGTEITNIIADDVIRGKDSELYKMYNDLIKRGYSESDALSKTALKAGSQVAWAGIGGALSGTVMGGFAGAKNYGDNKTIGKEIRGNERVTDMLNIASLSPQESDAYAAYTEYAKQGVNAENITDAQLGNLYGMADADARSTVLSKKATAEQKADAETTYNRLSKMKTENKAAKLEKEISQTDEEGVVTPVTREMLVNEKAQGMSNESEAKAELFRLVDDGHTNVEDYADSFNLVVDLARNDFSQDYILEHRGVLSTGQVNSIYQSVVTNPKMAQQKRLDALIQEQGDNLEIKGTIDDSVIDYDNTGAEGKVNWKDLHPNVKATIAYVSGFSTKVAGMDVQLVTNGRDYGFTGKYDRQGNTMLIDITALTEKAESEDGEDRKDNSKFVISTVAHEVTHWMEEKVPELYAQYDKMVMDSYASGGLSEAGVLAYRRGKMEEAEAKRAKKENRKPHEFTDKEVRREVIARASEDMLALSEEGKKFFESLTENEQKQFVNKIKEVIQNIKDWIKNVLSNLVSDAPEAIMLRLLAKDLDAISKKWDEMLRQAAKANAAMKKAGVNDKAIMESKVSDTQNADIDTDIAEQYNNWESYELTAEFVTKVPYDERHDFLRSLANQTNGLKQGERKNIIINTDKHVYFYAATGYMNGSIEDVLKVGSKKVNAKIKAWRDISGSSDANATTFDSWTQNYGSIRGRNGGYNAADGYAEETGRVDNVDDQAQGSNSVGYNWEGNGDFSEGEELIPGSLVYTDDGRAFKVNEDGTTEDVQFSDIDDDTQTTINQTMTMQQAKDMIQRAFVTGMIEDFYDGQYKNGDEWLAGEGADEVAFYIENEYSIVTKYLNPIQGYIDGDIELQDILNAYTNKTLTGKVKKATQWMDLSQNVAVADKRFYAPREIKNAKKKLEIAKQKIDKSNKNEVTKARAEILLYAHNKGAAETLGLTESELNKMLRQWGGYSASAREVSMRFNNNVALSNRWTGIENSSWLNSVQVSEKELARLVKSIEGDSQGFERNYIARTMLALDTHIDWSNLKFIFTGVVSPGRTDVRGTYDAGEKLVRASYHSPNTVAHEMGHALDNMWAMELGFGNYGKMTDGTTNLSRIENEQAREWYSHFQDFIHDLTDGADIRNSYSMDNGEVFARFVSSFVQWVDITATGRKNFGFYDTSKYSGDNFQAKHYLAFVKILQEKAMLDSKAMSAETDVQYSDIDVDQLDELNAQLKEKQNQIYSVSMELRKFDAKAEQDRLNAVIGKEGVTSEELDKALQEYANWEKESGYADAAKKQSALKDEEKLLRREIQKVEDRLHDELKEQIAHWDEEDVKKYVSKAVRKYHTTTRLDKASYLVTTGSMLDFSDGQGYRVKDHREISEILDLPDYAEYSDGMIAFMNMGNIRLQTYGIDVSAMPNAKQFTALRDIIFTVMRENDEFSVDFSKTNGYSAGSVTYGKGTSASKIIADIKSYFETGVVPEEQSSIRDFLYSDIDVEVDIYEVLGENKRLNKENKTLREDFERLMERMKLEKQVTHGKHLNENQLDIVAGHIRNLGKSNYSKPNLINKLRDVYTYIATSDEVTWDNLFARLYGIAEDVLDVTRPTYSPNDYYANIYRDMRNTEISLSDEQKKYVKDMLGVDWHKAFFGKIKVSDTGTPLNSKWEEWAGKYPNEFTETQDKDQVLALLDIYETAKELKEVVEEYDKVEQTRWLANEIYNQYWNVSAIRTTADKYDKQIKRLNYEHRNAMKELRDSYNERLEKQKQADRAERSRIFKKLREDHIKELQEIRKSGKERLDKYKEEAARKTRIHSITAQALTLNEWLVKNSKDKHIHESMKGPVVALLQAIDFSSKRALGMWGGDMKGVPTSKDISLQKALSQVQKMMADASVGKEELVLLYGHELDADIEAMIESVDSIMRAVGDNEFILNKMTLDDLITLDNVVKTIKHAVTQMNKFHIVNHAKGIANLAQEEIVYAEKLGKEKIYKSKSLKAGAKKLLAWKNINPYYAFKRFGAAGKKIFEAFQDGYDKFAFNIKEIIDFTNSTYNAKEVQDWEKEIKSFKLRMPATENELSNPDYEPQYQEIKMTVAQIMDLYLLNKREAARVHLLGGGIRVADIETKGSEVISQAEGALLEQSEIDQIIKTLTPRQIEVADALSHFMNTTSSDWGNEVSMARFGYKAFGEKNYVPMQVDKNNLAVDDETEKNNSLFRLLNMSFTKALTENASNRLVVSSIFDVFAQHTSDMAKYNALALPVLDAFRWYNYKEKGFKGEMAYDTKSVKQAIENAFGKDGQSYITTFLKDLNGQENTSRDTIGRGFFTKAKIAAVGANIRVALLQPTAYLKASANIDSKYLIRALGHLPKIGRAEKYCGMALWKSLGYFDTNVQRGVADQIKHAETKYDKAVELSMKGAEWGDKVTFGYLWNAAELEIREKRQDLKVGSDEFYFEVGKRLRDIIYSTQVVDSVMTRSEMMRSPDWGDKLITTFASEPTIAYSMLSDAYFQTQLDARELGSKKAAIKKNAKHMARVVVAYTATNLVAALVESGFDVLRDDDDEEMDMAEFMKLYLENFATNQSITAKIPWLKEAVSILQGFTSTRMDTQWIQTFSNTLKQVAKLMQGEGNPTKLIKNGLQTISYAFGLPFYNAYRDLMASLNKLGILTTEELEEILKDFIE